MNIRISDSNEPFDRPERRLRRDDVRRIAAEAGRHRLPPLDVVGVTGTGDSTYSEVVFEPAIGHAGAPVLIGVFRDMSESQLRDAIDGKLRGAG